MSVIYESQVVAVCDFCTAMDHSSVHTLTSFKQKLRQEGWSIGATTMCPDCKRERSASKKPEASLYKIEIWTHRTMAAVSCNENIRKLLNWYKQNWSNAFEEGQCAFFVYKDEVELSEDELFRLGFL